MNWQDCKNLANVRRYVDQAQPGDRIARAWREMLEDAWATCFELGDFIKVAYWRSEEAQAIANRLAAAVEPETPLFPHSTPQGRRNAEAQEWQRKLEAWNGR